MIDFTQLKDNTVYEIVSSRTTRKKLFTGTRQAAGKPLAQFLGYADGEDGKTIEVRGYQEDALEDLAGNCIRVAKGPVRAVSSYFREESPVRGQEYKTLKATLDRFPEVTFGKTTAQLREGLTSRIALCPM